VYVYEIDTSNTEPDRRVDWFGAFAKLFVPAMRLGMVFPSMPVHISNVAPQLGKLGAAVGNWDGLAVAGVGAFVGTKVGAAVGNWDGLAVARVGAFVGTKVGTAVGNPDGLAVAGVGAFVGTRVDINVRALPGMATRENEAGITTMSWMMSFDSSVYCQAIDKCSSPSPSFMRACTVRRREIES
jgi:hypothetical protein